MPTHTLNNAGADTEMRDMLVESARRWSERACAPAQRTPVSEHETGCPQARWHELAELGWLGVALPETDGGLGAGLPELSLLAEQLGRALLVEPYVASTALGSELLNRIAEGPLRHAWLPHLASGDKRIAWAAWEADGSTNLHMPAMQAMREGDRWLLTGAKGLMPGAGGANAWLVTAQIQNDPGRVGVFLVDAGASGLQVANQRLYDGRHAASLTMDHTAGTLLREGSAEGMQTLLNEVLDHGRVAHCAETLGTAQQAFEITLEYVRTRRQFGRALGDNQVVQHRLVDLYVELQETRALCLACADQPSTRQVAALCLRTTQVARRTWEEAIQLHGAIGMTEEYVLGEYVRRLALAANLYGGEPEHAERLTAASLEIPA